MSRRTFDDPTSDAARQFLLDNRSERKHPKRHRTLKKQRAQSEKKRTRVRHNRRVAKAAQSRFLEASRAYWAGDRDNHP